MASKRTLSFTEVQMALTCEAQHAFAYTGHLTRGQTLKRRALAATLSDGRAWGAGVAAWHAWSEPDNLFGLWHPWIARWEAHRALKASYAADVVSQGKRGVMVDLVTQVEAEQRLGEILDHYMATAERLSGLSRLEEEIVVSIPSRSGRRGSTRYSFQCFLDGSMSNGGELLVEFKLRGSFHSRALIQASRQIREYAWARQRQTGVPVVGVIVDERLNEAPKPARIVQGNKKGTFAPSHAKDQVTTSEVYIALCREFDEDPHDDVVAHLAAREWQRRTEILFRPGELEEAGRELVSAAQLIRDLDSGSRYPIRNVQPRLCGPCRFEPICPNPLDDLYVDTLFVRTEPKRLRRASAADSPSVPHSASAESAAARHMNAAGAESRFLTPRSSLPDVRNGFHESAANARQEERSK